MYCYWPQFITVMCCYDYFCPILFSSQLHKKSKDKPMDPLMLLVSWRAFVERNTTIGEKGEDQGASIQTSSRAIVVSSSLQKADTCPQFLEVCILPYAPRLNVKQEQDHLETDGILVNVT